MKKINNNYKQLKQQRAELFNAFKKAMDLEYRKGNLKNNISSIASEYGIIAEYIFNYYTNPQIQTEIGNEAVTKIKELSAKIELIHPKNDRKAFAKDNVEFIDSLLIIDAINLGIKNIDKETIVNTKKVVETNSLIKKYFPNEISKFVRLLDDYYQTAPIEVKEANKPIYEVKEIMKKNDELAKVFMSIETNPIVLQVIDTIQKQK